MNRYNKYLVIKRADIDKYLSQDAKAILDYLTEKIDTGRLMEKKPLHNYIVVNQTEPYAEKVWELIEENKDEST